MIMRIIVEPAAQIKTEDEKLESVDLTLIFFHSQRLSIAKEFGDKAAERRAYSNLGNALIFLGQFNTATEYYR